VCISEQAIQQDYLKGIPAIGYVDVSDSQESLMTAGSIHCNSLLSEGSIIGKHCLEGADNTVNTYSNAHYRSTCCDVYTVPAKAQRPDFNLFGIEYPWKGKQVNEGGQEPFETITSLS